MHLGTEGSHLVLSKKINMEMIRGQSHHEDSATSESKSADYANDVKKYHPIPSPIICISLNKKNHFIRFIIDSSSTDCCLLQLQEIIFNFDLKCMFFLGCSAAGFHLARTKESACRTKISSNK